MSTISELTPAMIVRLLKAKGFQVEDRGVWRTVEAISEWILSGKDLLADVEEPKKIGALLPKEWLDSGHPERIIVHWTAGAYLVSDLDKEHYHFIVDGDNKLFHGDHTVADNDTASDNDYAAHTRGCNTKSIGVSVACMAGAIERPFKEGRYPMKRDQWRTMAQVVAELCIHYRIPVTPQTVLGHGEVQRILGIAQSGKWDPMVLPWSPSLTSEQVGNMFRAEVQQALENLK